MPKMSKADAFEILDLSVRHLSSCPGHCTCSSADGTLDSGTPESAAHGVPCLQVEATEAEVKTSYKKLAMRWCVSLLAIPKLRNGARCGEQVSSSLLLSTDDSC
jgi:hypothetical protein